MMEVEAYNKEMVDKPPQTYANETALVRAREKKRFTDVFKHLDKEGRKLMSEMKQYGLGMWSEGKRGLFKYDPRAYDQERRADDADAFADESDILAEAVEDADEAEAEDQDPGYDRDDGDDGNDDA
jgi:hypothetical protein